VAGVLSIEIKGDFDRIVEHSVDQLAGRDVALEAQKFLVPVALEALTDRHPIEQVERRKQSGRAMANIIVGHRPGAPALHRQARLGAVERLGLALFVEREHRCAPANRAKYDHIAQFGGKLRVAALNCEDRPWLWTVPPKQSPELTIAGRRCGTGLWRPSRLIRRADARLVGGTGLRCPARPIRPADAGLIGCPRLICCTGQICCTGLRFPAGLIGCAGLRHRAGLIGCAGLRCPSRLICGAGLRCPSRLIGGAGLGRPSRLIGPLSMQRVGPMQNKT
jgi:hypothetical protein